MGDERPSDSLQPAAKKRAGQGGRDRDDPDDDDQPGVDPGAWTAEPSLSRDRRKVHVRRGAGGGGIAAAPVQVEAPQPVSNPFAGIALSFAPPPAVAEPVAGPAGDAAPGAVVQANAEAKPDVAEDEKKAKVDGPETQEPAKQEAATPVVDAKDSSAETAAPAQDVKLGTSSSPSGTTAPGSSIFGGSAGTTSGFASLAAGGATGGNFNFGGFGGSTAGANTGGLFGGGPGIFGSGNVGGNAGGSLFGATGGTSAFGGSFSFPKLDPAGSGIGKPLFSLAPNGEGSLGGEGGGEERPETFEPAEDPTIRPVVQLAVVQKVTGEENEQTLYAESGRLYEYDSTASKWRERGSGELRVNVSADGTNRMLMRQTGNLRLLLNARVASSMAVQRMQGASGVTFGCVNTAAPVDPNQPQQAAPVDGAGQDKGADKDAAGSKPSAGHGMVRTWAFRTKGEDKVLALLAVLEKAKQDCSNQDEKKDAGAAEV